MRLNEENLQLEGKVKIMGIENTNYKQSFANKGLVIESDRDIGGGMSAVSAMTMGGGMGGMGGMGGIGGVSGGMGTVGSLNSISTKKS